MLKVWGTGRGFRVLWLLEEMGLPYELREVDMLAGVENDPEFLAINPSGFIPALQDGDAIMVESIAILEYLMAKYGPTPLCPAPHDASFPLYQQFLHMGEAGLAMPVFIVVVSNMLAPKGERDNWGARKSRALFENRLKLVTRQLARAPYMAGDAFTAADISVAYALEFAERNIKYDLGATERAYLARVTARPAHQRAKDVQAKAWQSIGAGNA
jgi:glutathione S-transferase